MRKQTTFVVNPRYFAKIYQADRATMNEKCVFTELKQTFSKSLKYRHNYIIAFNGCGCRSGATITQENLESGLIYLILHVYRTFSHFEVVIT